MLQDKTGDIKKVSDLGDCGDFDRAKNRSLQQKLDASTKWSVPAPGDLHGLKPCTLSPSKYKPCLYQLAMGTGRKWSRMKRNKF